MLQQTKRKKTLLKQTQEGNNKRTQKNFTRLQCVARVFYKVQNEERQGHNKCTKTYKPTVHEDWP